MTAAEVSKQFQRGVANRMGRALTARPEAALTPVSGDAKEVTEELQNASRSPKPSKMCLDNSRLHEYRWDVMSAGTHRGLCPEEEVFLNLLKAAEALTRAAEGVLKAADVLPTQYNVLRILRGSPDGLPCSEIAKRMISRDPDMTRLLDRMEERGLISRERATDDRRVVVTTITGNGKEVLARLDAPVKEVHQRLLGHLGSKRLVALGELLRAVRERATEEIGS